MKSQGRGWVKKIFPGANTPEGFFSFYEHVIRPDSNKIIIIKGGPGVGKSTLMKKIATRLLDMGYDVEHACCASDSASLDGVVVHDIGFALLDGTAPHALEPRFPGVVEELVNLGEFWDERALRASKREIIEATGEVAGLFQRAFRYLKEAKVAHDDWEACYTEALDFGYANCMAHEISDDILHASPVSPAPGRPRHLFASAISYDGPVHHLETIVGRASRRYIVKGEPGTGKSTIVRKVGEDAILCGQNVEFYHCPLDPSKVEHLLIPGLGVALVSASWPHDLGPLGELDRTVDMQVATSGSIVAGYREIVESSRRRFLEAFGRAVEFLHRAKLAYDGIEAFYTRSMDFQAIDRLGEAILAEVLDLEREIREATA